MAASLVSLYNQALGLIGIDPISDPEASSKEADMCNIFYPDTRDEVLLEADWVCAQREAKLVVVNAAEGRGYLFAYQIPVDIKMLKLISLADESGKEVPSAEWVRHRDLIMTDIEDAYALYIESVQNVPEIDNHVAEAIIAKLASKLANPMIQSLALENQLLQRYAMSLMNAKMIEGTLHESRPKPVKMWSEVQ